MATDKQKAEVHLEALRELIDGLIASSEWEAQSDKSDDAECECEAMSALKAELDRTTENFRAKILRLMAALGMQLDHGRMDIIADIEKAARAAKDAERTLQSLMKMTETKSPQELRDKSDNPAVRQFFHRQAGKVKSA